MPPVVKPIFSQRYWAVRKRIQRLPQLMIGQMKVAAKKDAAGVIATFRFGIINDSLRLKKLKPVGRLLKKALLLRVKRRKPRPKLKNPRRRNSFIVCYSHWLGSSDILFHL